MLLEIDFGDERKVYHNVVSFSATDEETMIPTEGKFFRISPSRIDRGKFKWPREDEQQEKVRNLIQKAFDKVDKEPERFRSPVYTMSPKKSWYEKKVHEFFSYVREIGGYHADYIWQVLEWAQRISNGENWETLCNEPDTANWYRWVTRELSYDCLSFGKSPSFNQTNWLVGGSRKNNDCSPATRFYRPMFKDEDEFNYAVPLLIFKEIKTPIIRVERI